MLLYADLKAAWLRCVFVIRVSVFVALGRCHASPLLDAPASHLRSARTETWLHRKFVLGKVTGLPVVSASHLKSTRAETSSC